MNLQRIASSLVTRLVLARLVLMAVGTAASYYQLTRFLREDLTRVVAAQQSALAQYVASDVDSSLEQRRRFLVRLAGSLPLGLLDRSAELARWLGERHELQPLFSAGLLLAGTDGKLLASAGTVGAASGRPLAQDTDFRAVLAGQARIGRPRLGAVSGLPILPIGVPVKNDAGQVVALLIGIADLSANGFLDRLVQGKIGASGGIALVSPQDRLFVASTVPGMALRPTPPAGADALQDRAMAGYRGTGSSGADGSEELAAVAAVPSTGWYVLVRMPSAEALVTVARTQTFILRQRLVAIALVLVVVGLLMSWLLRPLYRAARQAQAMARGELPLASLPVSRADEVGHLTAAFNLLLERLASNQAELARMADHDVLTGLPNRKLLAERAQQALARSRRHRTRVALLFLDLDGFKRINDTLGHDAGDQVLREVGTRLLGLVRHADTVARLGGDEFIVLAADLEHPAEGGLATLAQKCLEALARPFPLNGVEQALAGSIGVAWSGGASTPEQLLAAADGAMYQAKQEGRGAYVMAPALP